MVATAASNPNPNPNPTLTLTLTLTLILTLTPTPTKADLNGTRVGDVDCTTQSALRSRYGMRPCRRH